MEYELSELIENNEWTYISIYQKLSEEFIEKYQDNVNWDAISAYQKLSEKLIEKYKDKVNWYFISRFQILSENFVGKHKNKLSMIYIGNYVRNSCYWCDIKLESVYFKNEKISYCPVCLR